MYYMQVSKLLNYLRHYCSVLISFTLACTAPTATAADATTTAEF